MIMHSYTVTNIALFASNPYAYNATEHLWI